MWSDEDALTPFNIQHTTYNMTFLNPAAFAWLLLAVPIVLLYVVVPGRRRRQTIATVMLWERAIARRSRYSGVRRWLSLAAVLMLLSLMVLALAEPFWGDADRGGRTLMIVVDRSASMAAEDGRFEQGLVAARTQLDELEQGDRAGLISFGEHTELHVPPTENLQRVREQLAALTPSSNGLETGGSALELARRMLEGESQAKIAVITDGAFEIASDAIDERVAGHIVGAPLQNLAITRFVLRPATTEGADDFAQINIRNLGREAVEGEVSLDWEEQTKLVTLAGSEEAVLLWPTDFTKLPPQGPWRATVAAADGVAGDNVATAEALFDVNADSNVPREIRRTNEADLTQRTTFPNADSWPPRGPLPTWLWPAILAAVIGLTTLEFAFFQRGLLE